MDGVNTDRRNASLIELNNLSRLSALGIHIPDFNIVPKDLFSMKLMRYEVVIGRFCIHSSYDISSLDCSRILRLELNIRRLWDDPSLEMLLKRSEYLGLYRSKGVNNLVPELDREGFSHLKCLIIAKNDDMECIINSMEQNHRCSAFLSLEVLCLKKLMYMEKTCHGKLSTHSFGKLRAVIVEDCDRLKNLFSFSIAKQLEELDVIKCKMMTEIVIYLREDYPSIIPSEAIAKFEFPQLHSLTLECLPKLLFFFHDESEAPFTSQKEDEGPVSLFNTMVAFPSLKHLALSTFNCEILWPDQLPETFKMQNLTTLNVDSCKSLKHVLSFAVARSLVQLRHLKVRQCCVMEEVLAINYTRNSEGMDRKLLPNLKHLHLEELPNLKRVCFKSWIKVLSMERLCIDACPKLEVADLLGELNNLKSLLLSSLDIVELPREIGQLTCLRSLTLIDWPKLEMIEPNIISSLPSLEDLKFQNSFTKWETEGVIGEKTNAHLSQLKNLSSLSTLHLAVPDVNGLPKDLFSTKLKGYNINIGEDKLNEFKNDNNSRKLELKLDTSSLLDEHVGLIMLMKGSEELGLNGLEGLNNVVYDLDWEGFPQLKFFQFQNKVGIQYIVNSMDKIHPCSAFVSLESLVLEKLVNLEKLCHGKLTDKCFGKLRKIDVSNCNRLKSLFSLSEAKILSKLKEIRVADCNMMEGIVIHEIVDDNQNISNNASNKFEFPQLYSLKVKSLPKFVQVFTEMKTNGTCQNQEEELVATFPIHFFNEKVKFPKLKALTLKGIATPNTIWNCQYEGQLGDDKEHAGILSRLEGLKLSELPQLMHLWEEDYHPVGRAFHNLKALFVSRCDRLKNLVPCSISFENLRYLRVSKCHGMENLLTPSTAKSLSQLRRMIITECRRMIQIVGDNQKGSDESEGEIVFSRLQVLELGNLPSLTSFYSGSNHILRFPNLEGVFVKSCCQMRSFCNGEVSTPELKKLILSAVKEDEYHSDDEYSIDGDDDYEDEEWDVDDKYGDRPMMELKEGDTNATIRQLSESGPVDT
ncbi:uncharacterized protein LOC107410504 [Ziziphus jujuba]|uniref:Uncharacterized protein LOC107410504 n=1 Tax=Ziziphus jujuba TaxID=326968 RepID=A0A6P6FVZ3_ZIZJJ|nr:uncharacterized protein LOC107410504 [Ziziphus jujuba]XP_060668457.1 uncharacterized protein LOC107410504 [Ziziphus jujuba]